MEATFCTPLFVAAVLLFPPFFSSDICFFSRSLAAIEISLFFFFFVSFSSHSEAPDGERGIFRSSFFPLPLDLLRAFLPSGPFSFDRGHVSLLLSVGHLSLTPPKKTLESSKLSQRRWRFFLSWLAFYRSMQADLAFLSFFGDPLAIFSWSVS